MKINVNIKENKRNKPNVGDLFAYAHGGSVYMRVANINGERCVRLSGGPGIGDVVSFSELNLVLLKQVRELELSPKD